MLSNVTFDAQHGVYSFTAASDTNPFSGYRVYFDPMTDEFTCECPSFMYSRERHCKHISRVGSIITDYVDSLESEPVMNPVSSPSEPVESMTNRFEVSFNDGTHKALDADTVGWLLDTIRVGDTLHLRRLS